MVLFNRHIRLATNQELWLLRRHFLPEKSSQWALAHLNPLNQTLQCRLGSQLFLINYFFYSKQTNKFTVHLPLLEQVLIIFLPQSLSSFHPSFLPGWWWWWWRRRRPFKVCFGFFGQWRQGQGPVNLSNVPALPCQPGGTRHFILITCGFHTGIMYRHHMCEESLCRLFLQFSMLYLEQDDRVKTIAYYYSLSELVIICQVWGPLANS